MSRGEFQLIEHYFRGTGAPRADVVMGVGDDAALVAVAPGPWLVSAGATAGLPFQDCPPEGAAPFAHRTLALALARVAARGGTPAWCTVGLTLPAADEPWIRALAQGLDALARRHGVALVGGDTTRGPLALSVGAHGLVAAATPPGAPRTGDLVYVVGEVAAAAIGLLSRAGEMQVPAPHRGVCERALDYPEPPLAAAPMVSRYARAAAVAANGIEDALAELLAPHGLGADLQGDLLPVAAAAAPYLEPGGGPSLALRAAGDLALVAAVDGARQGPWEAELGAAGVPFAWVGTVARGPGVRAVDAAGSPL